MANSTVPTKSTGDTFSAAELNNIVQAVNSKADQSALTTLEEEVAQKADAAAFGPLVGTAWDLDAAPLREITLAGATALTTSGTAGASRGLLLVTNPAAHTLTLDGVAVAVKDAGECLVTVIYKSSGIYYASDAGQGTATENTTPAAPTLTADDSANTLSASHALGASEILVSENDGAYTAYSGAIAVGDVVRAEGYWKFKTKAATGRNESPVALSPAFTVAAAGGGVVDLFTVGAAYDVQSVDYKGGPYWMAVTNDGTFFHTKVDSRKIAAGQAGKVWCSVTAGEDTEVMLGLRVNNINPLTEDAGTSPQTNPNNKVLLSLTSAMQWVKKANGSDDDVAGHPFTAPIFIGIQRLANGTLNVITSPDETTWTVVDTYTPTYTGDLYPVLIVVGNASYGLSKPKGENVA